MDVSRRLKDRHGHILRAAMELTQSQGRTPSAGQLAERLGISREDAVENMIAAEAYRAHSIDVPISRGDSAPRMVSAALGYVDNGFDRITDQESVRRLRTALPERERTVLYLGFFESVTQSQIAEPTVCPRCVSRMLETTLRELREQL